MSDKFRVNGVQVEGASQEGKAPPMVDELTNLYSRRYFDEFLKTELSRSHRYYHCFSLCFIEIDYLKQYSDVHGAGGRDALLRFMADLLKTSIRDTDLTCRYGEGGFVLVLTETPKKGAVAVAEKLRQTVEVYPFEGRDSQPHGAVTVSVGIAGFPEDALQNATLIERARESLQQAKIRGGNRVGI